MPGRELEVEVKRVQLKIARAIVGAVADFVDLHGWSAALYGSVLFEGEGRDVDILLAPTKPDAASADVVVRAVKKLPGFKVLIDEENASSRGIIGTWFGYAVDLTIAGGRR